MNSDWEELWERTRRLYDWLKRERPEVLEELSEDGWSGCFTQRSADSPFGRALAEWEKLGRPS